MENSRQARDFVLTRISSASIVVIDISEHLRRQMVELEAMTGHGSNGSDSTLAFLRSGKLPKHLITNLLILGKRQAIMNSCVPEIEALLNVANGRMGQPGEAAELLDPARLNDLTASELAEFIARFSLAIGDALDPCIQAEAIAKNLADMRYAHIGHVAVEYLEAAVGPNRHFDTGSGRAFDLLSEANDIVVSTIRAAQGSSAQFRPGKLTQEDSMKVLGIQAADIAAGYAREVFESEYGDTTTAAKALRRVFSRVMLNDKWLQ